MVVAESVQNAFVFECLISSFAIAEYPGLHPALWERGQHRVAAGDYPLLRQMIVVVAELSRHFYRTPIPSMFRTWSDELRPSVRIWIQNYAWTWTFAKNRVDQFSAAPVVLFLHQQYLSEGDGRRHPSAVGCCRGCSSFGELVR